MTSSINVPRLRRQRAFFPSAAKDDPPEAALLLDLLTRHRDRLRPLERDTVEMRSWQFLVEQRRQFVNEKTRQKNRLTAQWKLYLPPVLAWFDDLDTELGEEFFAALADAGSATAGAAGDGVAVKLCIQRSLKPLMAASPWIGGV